MRVFVIFENSDEETEFYSVMDPTHEVLSLMNDAHGCFGGCEDTDGDAEDALNELIKHFEDDNFVKMDVVVGSPFFPFPIVNFIIYCGVI